MKEQNAIIKSASITNERMLSAWISLDYGGMCQSFGGYVLYRDKDDNSNYAGLFISRVLEIVGVEEWSKLEGKTIRARFDDNKVHAIGHIVKDDWFNPSEEFKSL